MRQRNRMHYADAIAVIHQLFQNLLIINRQPIRVDNPFKQTMLPQRLGVTLMENQPFLQNILAADDGLFRQQVLPTDTELEINLP